MKRLAGLLLMLLLSAPALAQVHVTQPFKYLWDEQAASVNGTVGTVQVQHFELKVDNGTAINVVPLGGTLSTVVGNVTFTLPADPALALGAHTFTVAACSTTTSGGGCATSAPFSFVLDPNAAPAPTNLGVSR
jgi:hypothetical protein